MREHGVIYSGLEKIYKKKTNEYCSTSVKSVHFKPSGGFSSEELYITLGFLIISYSFKEKSKQKNNNYR